MANRSRNIALLLAGCACALALDACVRKTNHGCETQSECGSGAECVDGTCVSDSTGGVTGSGGTSTTGGSSADTGGSKSTGGSAETGGFGDTGGSGGSKAGTGGSGDGGSATSGGGGAGGGASGGSGSGTGGSGGQPGELVDDMEDADGRILEVSGRAGPWHPFNSGGGGTQTPAATGMLTPESGGHGSSYAMHTSGSGFEYAGIGFDLNNSSATPESTDSKPYDASKFSGISFWVKGTAKLRLEVPTRQFVPSDRGGNCASDCWNVYGYRITDTLSANDWKEIRVTFASMERQSGGKSPAMNKGELMSISFKHEGTERFDFWIDDIRLY